MSYLRQGGPNEVGGFELASEINLRKPSHVVMPKVAVSIALIALMYVVVFSLESVSLSVTSLAIVTGGILVYLGIAWLVRPEANENNMGWMGGLMDAPFQHSDNFNRFLWKLKIAFMPGRFVTQSFIELATLLHFIPEVTHEDLIERKATELSSRSEPEDVAQDDGNYIELSSAKYFQNSAQ